MSTKEYAAAELSSSFRNKFITKIGGAKGKDAILYSGLLALAHANKNFGHIEAQITQYPSADNKWTAFARATIYDSQHKIAGMEEADANAGNCGKMTAASFPRMALTRAKARAFRDFLNIDMVASEEIATVFEPEAADPMTIGKIKKLAKAHKITKDELFDFMDEIVGTDTFQDLTEEEANQFLQAIISEYGEQPAPVKRKKKAPVVDDDEEFDIDED